MGRESASAVTCVRASRSPQVVSIRGARLIQRAPLLFGVHETMATESLLITCLADGTYHVKETEGQEPAGDDDTGEQPIDQSVQSTDDVMTLVQQFLSDCQDDMGGGDASSAPPDDGSGAAPDASGSGQAAWNAEASKRDPSSGLRK